MADGRMKDVAETRGPRESNLISKTMKNTYYHGNQGAIVVADHSA